MDPRKIKAVLSWLVPTTLKALRGFLGLAGYYRKFIQGFGGIASLLTQLLNKNAFGLSEVADESFDKWKLALPLLFWHCSILTKNS